MSLPTHEGAASARRPRWLRAPELLFIVSLLELFVGGGGRLTELGSVPLRMVLFAVCLLTTVALMASRPERVKGVALPYLLVACYLLVHLPAALHGLLLGNDESIILAELQQSIYWLAAPFFAMILSSRQMVFRTALLAQAAGIFLALAYFAVLLAMLTVIADPVNFYLVTLEESPEIALRGSGLFFYKGFLYLGIAVVFLITLQGRRWRLLTLFVLLALALSLTRGFILSTAAAVTLGLVIQRRWRLLAVTLAAFSMVVFVYWGYLPSVDDDVAEQRETSNAQRLDDMAFIADNATVQTVLIGQGFGSPINGRTLIENTFLWAFWRMGLAGVAFWLSPLILCAAYFVKVARTSPMHGLACAFFCSTVLVYVQTMTNPYLSNPIGLSFVIVSIFSLRTLARSRPHVVICASSRSSNDDRPLTPRPRPVRDAS